MVMENQVPKVAVVQMSSVAMAKLPTIEKICLQIRQAAKQNAQLVVFPEAVVPGYPRGQDFGVVVGHRNQEGRELWMRYWQEAVTVPGPEMEMVAEAAREAGVYVALGIVERESARLGSSLFCTLVFLGPNGALLGKHRKLKPTAAERVIWGEGDGKSLRVYPTPLGRMGGLICWENYMPLARMALYQQQVEIYLAPTADARDSWQATLQHIASEGRCFVLSCNQVVYRKDLPPSWLATLPSLKDPLCRGGSAILSPTGEYLAGPLWDQEGILYALLDPNLITKAKFDFDVAGHYHRPDVFGFTFPTDDGE